MNKKLLFSYVLPRDFHGYNIPISIQSMYIKNYAENNGYQFVLPVTEISVKDNYYMLKKFSKKNTYNLAMTSIFILPIYDVLKCKTILKSFSERCSW